MMRWWLTEREREREAQEILIAWVLVMLMRGGEEGKEEKVYHHVAPHLFQSLACSLTETPRHPQTQPLATHT